MNSATCSWFSNPSCCIQFSDPHSPMPTLAYFLPTVNTADTDPTSSGMYPFQLHFISGNISVCNSCKGKYRSLGPPYDICLQHKEWRTFTPQGKYRSLGSPYGICLQHKEWRTFTPQGSSQQTRFGNVYYYCNVSCVHAVWPSFIPYSVVVSFEVKTRLQPEHVDWLFANFGVIV